MLTVHIETTRTFEAGLARFSLPVVLIAGVALSLLLASVFLRLLASRDAAEARARSKPAGCAGREQWYLIRQMIDSVPARLSLWSPASRCRLANRALCTALVAVVKSWSARRLPLAAVGTPTWPKSSQRSTRRTARPGQQREWSLRQPMVA